MARATMNRHRLTKHGLSTPKILAATIRVLEKNLPELKGRALEYLDIGAGNGELIDLVSQAYEVKAYACDYTDELMQMPEQKVEICDLNRDPLPYGDSAFDLVTFTEVIEHLEHDRQATREIFRVLKPGGHLVLTTPNILNLKSRLRFLTFGFWNLFGPLHLNEGLRYSVSGHINPISYFYIVHSLLDSGFRVLDLEMDKAQRSSLLALPILWVPVRAFGWLAFRRERRKGNIDDTSVDHVRRLNGLKLLLSRTVILLAEKPRD